MWLSGYQFAQDVGQLAQNNITAVVSAVELGILYPPGIEHYVVNLRDHEEEEIRYTFIPVYRFIEQQRKAGRNVLIHCAAGISRSAALLISYMMNKYHTAFEACLHYVAKKRPCVMPNAGFVLQLKRYGSDLGVKDGASNLK